MQFWSVETQRFCVIQARIHCDLANWHRQQIDEKSTRKALDHCKRALQLSFRAMRLLKKTNRKRKRDDDNKTNGWFSAVGELKVEAYLIKARIFMAINEYSNAIGVLQRAICVSSHPTAIFLLASCHKRLGNSLVAIPLFSSILSSKCNLQFASYLQLGKCLSCVGENEAAIKCYESARELFPQDINQSPLWHFHFGEFLGNLRRYSTALPYIMEALRLFNCCKHLQTASSLNSDFSRANTKLLSPFDQALDEEEEGTRWLAYGLAISYNSLLCKRKSALDLFHQLQAVCNFDETLIACAFVPYHSLLIDMSVSLAVNIARNAAYDFEQAAILTTCAKLLLSQAQILEKCEVSNSITAKHRQRIGYVSSDFNRHCIGDLLLSVFQHQKLFEVFAFSTSTIQDTHQQHIKASVSYFIDISTLSCTEAASLIRSFDIDVLVDLNGYTQGSRTLVFALRCAKLQLSWLGYPGTSGASFIDMVIVDPVIASGTRDQFTEKLFIMPYTYQANSYRTTFASLVLQPQIISEFFDFVNYNRLEKIDEDSLQAWIRILKRASRARLHLLASPIEAVAEIKTGLADVENQIVWVQPCSPEENMTRLSRAHVLLDTHLYNSHTSASDALWAGTPILTCPGVRMHSRIAASLVTAVGCASTMIASNFEEYEEKAVDWACNPEIYQQVRAQLHINVAKSALFRPDLWIQDFERGLTHVLEKPLFEDFFVSSEARY